MATSDKLNTINFSRVLNLIWQKVKISRIEIAKELNLDKSTITKIVNALMDQNIIITVDEGDSSPRGGRKPIFLSINPNYGYVLGIEIQTERYTVVVENIFGEIKSAETISIVSESKDFNDILSEVFITINKKIKSLKNPVVGIGIGIAGIIDPYKGIIHQSNPLDIINPENIYKLLPANFDIPLVVENDANCCCWGELAQNKTDRHRNFLCLLSEIRAHSLHENLQNVAVGLGLVLKGSVHHGDSFSAGEFQSVLSTKEQITQFAFDDKKTSKFAEDTEIRKQFFKEIALNLAFLVNTLNLTKIVITGDLKTYIDELQVQIDEAIDNNWSYKNKVKCNIDVNRLEKETVAAGAAGMFIEKLFSLPDLTTQFNEVVPNGYDLFQLIEKKIKN